MHIAHSFSRARRDKWAKRLEKVEVAHFQTTSTVKSAEWNRCSSI